MRCSDPKLRGAMPRNPQDSRNATAVDVGSHHQYVGKKGIAELSLLGTCLFSESRLRVTSLERPPHHVMKSEPDRHFGGNYGKGNYKAAASSMREACMFVTQAQRYQALAGEKA